MSPRQNVPNSLINRETPSKKLKHYTANLHLYLSNPYSIHYTVRTRQICEMLCKSFYKTWSVLGWKASLRPSTSNPSAIHKDTFHKTRFLKPMSNLALNASRDDASTFSVCNLYHRTKTPIITQIAKNHWSTNSTGSSNEYNIWWKAMNMRYRDKT